MPERWRPTRPIAEPVSVSRDPDGVPTALDNTGQIKILRTKTDTLMRMAKRHRMLLGLVVFVASSTATGVAYKVAGKSEDRLAAVEKEAAATTARQQYDHEMLEWNTRALYRLSRAMRVEVPPPPESDGGTKEKP